MKLFPKLLLAFVFISLGYLVSLGVSFQAFGNINAELLRDSLDQKLLLQIVDNSKDIILTLGILGAMLISTSQSHSTQFSLDSIAITPYSLASIACLGQ